MCLKEYHYYPPGQTDQGISFMGTEPLDRKLAAILYADVAGYSRLTGEDEEGTHRALSAYLDTLTTSIERHNGKVLLRSECATILRR